MPQGGIMNDTVRGYRVLKGVIFPNPIDKLGGCLRSIIRTQGPILEAFVSRPIFWHSSCQG